MKSMKNFSEFIKEGIVRKIIPDKSRAEFLVKEAEQSYGYVLKLIEKMGIDEINSNDYIKKCYDILIGLVRAKMLFDGLKAFGFGAHEAEVSYSGNLGFNEKDIQFLNQIRFFRNGILYYGTKLDKEYAKKVLEFTKGNYIKLIKALK